MERRMSLTSVFPVSSPTPVHLLEGASSASREGVVKVLVGALADSAREVRNAAAASLKDPCLARENAIAILEACSISLRSGKRRGGHNPLVLEVMATTVEHMEESQLDSNLLHRLAKQAILEMTYPKDLDSDGIMAATSLLVATGLRMPDVMMEEAFRPPTGSSVPTAAVVRALAQFAERNAVEMVPRLKKVLSRVLPVLGSVYDGHRFIFAEAMSSWCEAIVQYRANTGTSPLDNDMKAAIHSAFELFSGRWLATRDSKVRMAVVEALGRMAGLIRRVHLKAALSKLLPSVLSLYRKETQEHYGISHGLRAILEACLGKDNGPPLVDFQAIVLVLTALLPKAGVFPSKDSPTDPNSALKNSNEVLGCFGVVGATYPDDICSFLVNRIGHRDEQMRMGVYAALRYLIFWLGTAWERKKHAVVDAVKSALHEENLNLRKALAQVIVAMASNGYLEEDNAEPFIKFLIWQCRYRENNFLQHNRPGLSLPADGRPVRLGDKDQLKVGATTIEEIFAVCNKSLLLVATTLPGLQRLLWPVFLKQLMPRPYTGAVATICKCITVLAKHQQQDASLPLSPEQCPQPQVLLVRLLVLLQNNKAPHRRARHILEVLRLLGLFFRQGNSVWNRQISKMVACLNEEAHRVMPLDTGQTVWESMIMELLSISLDEIGTEAWAMAMANAMAAQYDLYQGDHPHTSMLHRCFALAVQKSNDKAYVRDKINVMYRRADIAVELNRHGLGMGMGLVAARHLDTVLTKLHKVLETEGRSWLRWIVLYFEKSKQPSADDVCAALALMYGYVAAYAPSNVIEARIETLVGTNVLTHLIDVRTSSAKQAVITAITLLAKAVHKAAISGVPFPLKKRDDMIGYMLMYMADTGYSLGPPDQDLLKTQAMALKAISVLVVVEPKLGIVMRDRIIQAAGPFFALPTEPSDGVQPIIANVTSVLCALLHTSLEDGHVTPDLLLLLLRQLEPYASSFLSLRRSRACSSSLALLCQFRFICKQGQSSHLCEALAHLHWDYTNIPSQMEIAEPPLLPSRAELKLGQQLVVYISRCADSLGAVRLAAVRALYLLFSIALLLPSGPAAEVEKEAAHAALAALEGLILLLAQAEASDDSADNFKKIVSAVGVLLTPNELISFLLNVNTAFTDRTLSAAQGALSAALQLILLRGHELNGPSLPRITENFISAASMIYDQSLKQSVMTTVCALAEHAQAGVVFNELLAALEKDAGLGARSLGARRREPWPIHAVLQMVANSPVLGRPLLDHLVDVVEKAPLFLDLSQDDGERPWTPSKSLLLSPLPQAAVLALAIVFQCNTESIRQNVDSRYSGLFCTLLLRTGNVRSSVDLDLQQIRDFVSALQAFCDCTGDSAMKEITNQYADTLAEGENWIRLVEELATCQAKELPGQIDAVCKRLFPALKSLHESERAAAAAAFSKYLQQSDNEGLLEHLVEALCSLTSDGSPLVRRLCINGLVKMSRETLAQQVTRVLSVTAALIDDKDEHVVLSAVQGLPIVLEMTPESLVTPLLLSVCARLFVLQKSASDGMRAAAFIGFGAISRFTDVDLQTIMLEQIHSVLPRLLFHVNDDSAQVRAACKGTLRKLAPQLHSEALEGLLEHRAFHTDRRLKYNEFVRDFVCHLAAQFEKQTGVYLSSALESLESPWPAIQANAAFFIGCFLSRVEDADFLQQYIPQASFLLVRMATTSTSAVVRTNAASALSMLLGNIPPALS